MTNRSETTEENKLLLLTLSCPPTPLLLLQIYKLNQGHPLKKNGLSMISSLKITHHCSLFLSTASLLKSFKTNVRFIFIIYLNKL